jgi:murein DD-endopeptidase MepM/ murein hydrolase activator NlpD
MGNHRAQRNERAPRRTPSAPPLVGRRRAVKARRPGLPVVGSLPSAPILVGVTALAVSAGGAVTATGADVVEAGGDEMVVASSQSGATTATETLSRRRGAVVSRDSRRDALADKADAKLVDRAEAQAEQRNAALEQFAAAAEKQARKIKLDQWVLPLEGYRLSAHFGASSYLWSTVHTGLDMSAPSGTPIMSVANGVVTETGYDGSYGNKTVVTLEDGTEIWYCHQTSFEVSPGDTVRGGDVIGSVGSTGNSTGPHLHIEVRPGGGDPVDPYSAFIEHGLQP